MTGKGQLPGAGASQGDEDAELREALDELAKTLYPDDPMGWSAVTLIKNTIIEIEAFREWGAQQRAAQNEKVIEPAEASRAPADG